MFCIIEYTAETYDNVILVPILFGSEFSAKQYAGQKCARNYKIVEL